MPTAFRYRATARIRGGSMRAVLPGSGGWPGRATLLTLQGRGALRQQFWHIKGAECNTFF